MTDNDELKLAVERIDEKLKRFEALGKDGDADTPQRHAAILSLCNQCHELIREAWAFLEMATDPRLDLARDLQATQADLAAAQTEIAALKREISELNARHWPVSASDDDAEFELEKAVNNSDESGMAIPAGEKQADEEAEDHDAVFERHVVYGGRRFQQEESD